MCLVCLSAFRLSCLFVCLSLCLSGCLLECVCRESFVLKQSTRLAVHLQPIKLSIFHASSRWNKQGERKAIDHKMCFLGKTNYHEEAFFFIMIIISSLSSGTHTKIHSAKSSKQPRRKRNLFLSLFRLFL